MRSLTISLFVLIPSLLLGQQKHNLTTSDFSPIADSVQKYIHTHASVGGVIKIDTFYVYPNDKIRINFSNSLSEYPIRDNDIMAIYNICKALIPVNFKNYTIEALSCKTPIEELSSKYYSNKKNTNKREISQSKWVENISIPYEITNGLQNRHIALWQSHGFYYEQKLMRWEWQRARIFQTVEDLYTQSYVVPFLIPMLENAGACVAIPRERDCQRIEIIVDNDLNASELRGKYSELLGRGGAEWTNSQIKGFANPKNNYLSGENPFQMGTSRMVKMIAGKRNNSKNASVAQWSPMVEQSGNYAVYISYQTIELSSSAVEYIVHHNGGDTHFVVDQTMGGGTWVYLGTFGFNKGDQTQGVSMLNTSPYGRKYVPGSVAIADGVKFGGGMGNIARSPHPDPLNNQQSAIQSKAAATTKIDPSCFTPQISGYPRFTEGARYWLQWAGYDLDVYSPNENQNDYNDDYMSRGKWVNTLCGGSSFNPAQKGKNVPIDLSMAFHTDAGTTINDSIIGSLAIYTRFSEDKDIFPNGDKRIISRELADLIQTQIVDDIRLTYEPNWTRRGLWDKSYNESRMPVVPSMLLELLSHQNFADMRYGLDPRFRFVVSRAIYKGILHFLSQKDGFDYVVQPLPVNSFAAEIIKAKNGTATIKLSWKPTTDTLESTASPTKYILYTRTMDNIDDESGFDNGTIIEKGTECQLTINKGKIYSYKIVPINDGGAGFPSEILTVGYNSPDSRNVLIVNGFDRVSAPASFATSDSTMAGFDNRLDGGVPYLNDYSFIGEQHEYRRHIPWMDDDAPGFGASYSNFEDKVISGNTFDYPLVHGKAIFNAGYNFVSCSRDAITSGRVNMLQYPIVDFIMGKQVKYRMGREGASKESFEVFPTELQKNISEYCRKGGKILISGSYIATDIWDRIYKETPKRGKQEEIEMMKKSIVQLTEQLSALSELYNSQNSDDLSISITKNIDSNLSSADTLIRKLMSLKKEVAYIEMQKDPIYQSKLFAMNTLKYKWMTHYASSEGVVKCVENPLGFKYDDNLSFYNTPNDKTYHIESPDGLVPVGENACTIFRYGDNNISAGVAYKGKDYSSISLGFPIETLKSQNEINSLIDSILKFLEK